MMVEMLVRRVVDGRVQLSVELVDTNKGGTECVARSTPVRLTALAVETPFRRCINSSITDGLTVVEDDTSLRKNERISTS